MSEPLTTDSRSPGQAREFAVAQARAQLKHLTAQIGRAAKSAKPEAIHHVRVAIRRFTQSIALCQPFLGDATRRKHRRRLKKIMDAAGEVRNCDIALKFASKHAAHLRSKLQERRQESASLLIAELGKWTQRRIVSKWRAALNTPPSKETLPAEPARELAERTLARCKKEFEKQGDRAVAHKASPEVLHHFRIFAKKFRYSLELFQPLYGSALDAAIEIVKQGGALLGDVNDCVTVAALVAEYKGGHALADRLKKRQRKKTAEFLKYWKERPPIDLADSPPLKKPVASSDRRRRSAA